MSILLTFGALAQGQIIVEIKGVESDKGTIFINLYQRAEGFPSDWSKAFKQISIPATEGTMNYTFQNIPWGSYAISIAHDENDNGTLDTNFIGMPKEPVGASNQTRLGKPKFERSRFEVNENNKRKKIPMIFIN